LPAHSTQTTTSRRLEEFRADTDRRRPAHYRSRRRLGAAYVQADLTTQDERAYAVLHRTPYAVLSETAMRILKCWRRRSVPRCTRHLIAGRCAHFGG